MRKSSLILLLAMAFVLTTVAAGFSASTVLEGPCKETCKDWKYKLHIDTTYSCSNPAQAVGTCPQCPLLDYESADGYCGGNGPNNYRYNAAGIIFKICDCVEPVPYSDEKYDINKSYGIKIEILEPTSGVYFTNENLSGADYGCDVHCDGNPVGPGSSIYVSAIKDITEAGNECPRPCRDATVFSMNYKPLNDNEVLFDPAGDIVAPGETCADAFKDNLANSIVTSCQQPFLFTDNPYILVDLPTMVFDPKAVAAGGKIKVKVTLMDQNGTGVCPDCKELCTCIVEVGIFGCETNYASSCTQCFPYFPALDDSWWAGFVLTNSGSEDADVAMTFTAGGVSVPVTLTVKANSVLVKSLSEFSLTSLEGKGGIYAVAVGTVPVASGGTKAAELTGLTIMGDSVGAYGYLTKSGSDGHCGCK